MTTRFEVLRLTDGMPARALANGELLFGPEDTSRAVAVLVDGRLQVDTFGSTLAVIDVPGAFVGEVSALLDVPRSATVTAVAATTVRIISDPITFFGAQPELALELARQLAGRLYRLTAYLGDVRTQYADADGHLGLVSSVLGRLAAGPPVDIEPGSDRAPDY